jgi:DNA-binding LacI/PurR family transcriptional regulator
MAAALERRVRVPKEMKLVFHHNTGVDWVCPLPVDWVESDVAEWAAALIRQVRQQKAGETVTPITLPYRLVSVQCSVFGVQVPAARGQGSGVLGF